jgi:hypothetical protein
MREALRVPQRAGMSLGDVMPSGRHTGRTSRGDSPKDVRQARDPLAARCANLPECVAGVARLTAERQQVCGSSEEANADRDHRCRCAGVRSFPGLRARSRRRPRGSHADGAAPIDGGVLRTSIRKTGRVHADAHGPARAVPRRRYVGELPSRCHRRGQRRGRVPPPSSTRVSPSGSRSLRI